MARKAQSAEPSEAQQGDMGVMPEAGTEVAAANAASGEQPDAQPAAQPGPSTEVAGAMLPATVISEVDRSLVSAQSPLLSRQQLKDLRSKLKTRFH